MTIDTSSSSSPRGPSIEVTEHAIVSLPGGADPWTALAEEGFRAIQDLERVLFFTDLPEGKGGDASSTCTADSEDRQARAEDGFRAIHDLERILFFAQQDNNKGANNNSKNNNRTIETTASTASTGCTHIYCNTHAKKPSPSYSSDLMVPNAAGATLNMIDLFKTHFQSALEAGQNAMKAVERTSQEALKEAQRTLFFTDVDDVVLAKKNPTGASVDVFQEMEVLLVEMEKKLSLFAAETGQPALETGQRVLKEVEETGQRVLKEVERSSQKAYKECERTLLFTDLDDSALAKDKTNDDLINHFLNSQEVFQELERTIFFTDLDDKQSTTRADV